MDDVLLFQLLLFCSVAMKCTGLALEMAKLPKMLSHKDQGQEIFEGRKYQVP